MLRHSARVSHTLQVTLGQPGNDKFTGYSQYATMASAGGSVAENDIAAYFSVVYAYSFVGGSDTAYVYDPTVNQVFGFRRIV